MIGTPRRTCRGRPIICPGPCNHRRQKCIEKKLAEKPHWHACSWFNVNDNDEDDEVEEDDEKEIDVGKICLPPRVDETATMTANVTLIDVALSQIAVSLEKKEENTRSRPIRCTSSTCSQATKIKDVIFCPEQNQVQSFKPTLPPAKVQAKKSMRRKNKKFKNYTTYLLIFCLYAIVHMFFAFLATRASLYEFFLSSQICGIAAGQYTAAI